ncbi:MAG TPA: UDP-N-acetylglucosamine--N-acetylmuramyl-(pentapeptide) pyrophosphoryl-undecaprenol N-acetylglucosamine transferase [Candidatus Paceibacterota bacterium]|nr:UDP-N-acetylglucosamine--N-acetylmuramyl-(pentapeptide) pyrophosphoryl-undecaprenol N-acetylglucosamine transferase [Candidatus Paceibacterota bacterium]
MKILLTGGGSGGHFYPLVAIAEELNRIADEERIINMKLYYMAPKPGDPRLLEEQFITFIPITAGKLRVYFSLRNIIDIGKTAIGSLRALFKVFKLYPDVVISKGGYASFPVLLAARLLRIPVIIHESDTVPGRVSKWSGRFAKKIALSYPEAATYFDKKKIAVTGQPVSKSLIHAVREGSRAFFELPDPELPTIGVWGGSQGAKGINDVVVDIVPELIEHYQIIHQTGEADYKDVTTEVEIALGENTKRNRYKAFSFLNDVQTKEFAGAVDLVVSRAGSSLFEIAAWGKPSIVIPYALAHDNHQRSNAYHYARTGACVVIEETNLTPSVLFNEIQSILENKERYNAMAQHARAFFTPDAARSIATEAISIALSHETA